MSPAARRSIAALVALVATACDPAAAPQQPPLDPPSTSPSATGDDCASPVAGTTVIRFTSEGVCQPGDAIVLYGCPGSDVPVLRLGSARRAVNFLGGPFAVPVESIPANVRFVGRGDGREVLVADPVEAPPAPTPSVPGGASASASPSASPQALVRTEPLVYVRRNGVTERWLPMARPRSVADPPVLWLIGDSIMDGGRAVLASSLGEWALTLDALVGRPSSVAPELALAAVDQEADVVVVELGTNDPSAVAFRDHLVETLGVLRETPLVIWQTVRAPERDVAAAEINETIREVIPRLPNTAIADWQRFVPAEALMEDGIHPQDGFESLEAELLSPILDAWLGAVSGEGATSCGPRVLRATR